MKKIILIISIFLLLVTCDDNTVKSKKTDPVLITYESPDLDYAVQILESPEGGYIILGNTESYGAGGMDIWLIKVDDDGNEEWDRTFGTAEYDIGYSMALDTDGNIIITGKKETENQYRYSEYGDLWIIKINISGDVLWERTYGGNGADVGNAIVKDSDNTYMITGSKCTDYIPNNIYSNDYKIWTLKINSLGDSLWSTTVDFQEVYEEGWGYSIAKTIDNGYVISAGCINDEGAVIKINSAGEKLWNNKIGWHMFDGKVQTLDNGNILHMAYQDHEGGKYEMRIDMMDNSGNILWTKENYENANQMGVTGRDIYYCDSGDIYITGGDVDWDSNKLLLLKLDNQGNEKLVKVFDTGINSEGKSMIVDSNGNIIIIGEVKEGNIYSGGDIFFLKLTPEELEQE